MDIPPFHHEADPDPRSSGRSELARELRSLTPGQRKTIQLEDWMVDIVELVTTAAVVLTDPVDERPMSDRLNWLAENTSLHVTPPADIESWAATFSESDMLGWMKRVRTDSWRRFLQRLLGAATYHRLTAALVADAKHVTRGFQQLTHALRPYALALDNCAGLISPNAIANLGLFGPSVTSALRLLVSIDAAITDIIDLNFDFSALKFDPRAADEIDFVALLNEVGTILSHGTREKLDEISSRLVRKLVGASTALQVSEDGPAQAASSLIELIDRLLRTSFPDDEVALWLKDTGRAGEDYTYTRDGIERPTKRAQALCFMYGGQRTEPSPIHDLTATALVTARSQLQKVKHADTGTPEEKALVASLISTIEGFLTLATRVGWLALPPENVEQLRQRLAA